jgi:hypothetical protein
VEEFELEGGVLGGSEVLAYLEEEVNGFLFDFIASSTCSATRLRCII